MLTQSDTALLHERVCTALDEHKSAGWPIERILIRLKEVAKEVGFDPPQNTRLTSTELERREVLWDEIIKECIEQYYRA